MNAATEKSEVALNSPMKILLASLIGTTIEYFDFYIFGTAAVLVFPKLFFAASDPSIAILQSLATFGLAFVARPVGSALFGHFGDRVGRKATLVVSLLTMGVSTVLIGLLPSYAAIGIAAPIILAVLRFGQGLGLGGEWGGAILLATENAPPEKRAWYGMFPQLGGPLVSFCRAACSWSSPPNCLKQTFLPGDGAFRLWPALCWWWWVCMCGSVFQRPPNSKKSWP